MDKNQKKGKADRRAGSESGSKAGKGPAGGDGGAGKGPARRTAGARRTQTGGAGGAGGSRRIQARGTGRSPDRKKDHLERQTDRTYRQKDRPEQQKDRPGTGSQSQPESERETGRRQAAHKRGPARGGPEKGAAGRGAGRTRTEGAGRTRTEGTGRTRTGRAGVAGKGPNEKRPAESTGRGPTRKGPAGPQPVRLNRYIANSGICSRRDADKLILAGLVTVNGKTVTELGTKVSQGDDVRYNGERLRNERKVYVLLNKPKDFVTTTDDPRERKTVMQLVKNACSERIYPVGRLDRQTTGVLLFTNDGELAKKLTHPGYNKSKIYHVILDRPIKAADLQKLAGGINLEDGFFQPDEINYVRPDDKREIGLEIHSGRNRIVRRMFESLEYRVAKLDRVYFAGLTKKNLPRGKWRFLTQKEVNMLKMNAYR